MSLFHLPRDRIRESNSNCRQDSMDTDLDEKFDCNICDNEYDSETELHLHRKAKHKTVISKLLAKEHTCQICIETHKSNEELLKHLKTMHFLSSEDAQYVEREIFICDLCHLIYFNKQMLALHLVHTHDPENKQKRRAPCPKCNKNIRVKQTWFHFHRHMIHSVSCCPICIKKCKNRKLLMEHIKEHPSYYHCGLCQYHAKTLELFNTHMKTHKKGFLSFKNSVVDQCFIPTHYVRRTTYNFGLNGLALYGVVVCILCRAITTLDNAPDHMRIHLVENSMKKEYACVCGEKFFNNVLLKHHVFKFKGDHAPDTLPYLNSPNVSKQKDAVKASKEIVKNEPSLPDENVQDIVINVDMNV